MKDERSAFLTKPAGIEFSVPYRASYLRQIFWPQADLRLQARIE